MAPLILLAEINVCEITAPKSYSPSVFPVNYVFKKIYGRVNSSSNSPRVVDKHSRTLYNPNDKRKLEETQYHMRSVLRLDIVTIREAIRKLNTYIALNPQPRELEVIIIQILMFQDRFKRDDEVMSWLRELEYDEPEINIWKNFRVEDMDFKDDEEYCCPICLENMAEQKEKVLPVRRMSWSHMFSVFIEYFTKRNDFVKDLIKRHHTMVTKTICNHVFHNRCISKWTEYSPTCPVCRLDFNKLTRFNRPFLEI